MSSSETPAPAPGSSAAPVPAPAPAAGGKGKGKDLSRMSAPPAPVASTPAAPPVTTVNKESSPGKKGKDLSRMVANAQPSTLPSEPKATPQEASTSKPPTPTGKPKGKDLSRMAGAPISNPSSQTQQPSSAALALTVPECEQQRRQSIARAAAGLPDVAKPIDITQHLMKTLSPSWSEMSLQNMYNFEVSKPVPEPPILQKKYGDPSQAPLIGTKLQNLCNSIDPSYTLDSKVQEMLLEMADGFIDKVTQDALKLAKHRGSNMLEVVDVALALKKGYDIEVPGLGSPSAPTGNNKKMIGGWLFANRISVDEKGGKKKPRLK